VALVPLFALFFCMIKCGKYRSEQKKKNAVDGDVKDYIPVKAIDRISSNILGKDGRVIELMKRKSILTSLNSLKRNSKVE
jgi:hypothetical protein